MRKKIDDFENINPYEVDKLSKIPSWIKILFMKFWTGAAAVYLGAVGFNGVSSASTDDVGAIAGLTLGLIVFIGLILSIMMNYGVKLVVKLMNNRRNNTLRFNMVNLSGFISFIVSLCYYTFLSYLLYFVIVFLGEHNLILNLFGTTNYGLEPFSYGLCFITLDFCFLVLKNIIISLAQRARYYRLIKD